MKRQRASSDEARASKQKQSVQNLYAGYTLRDSSATVPKVEAALLSPADFFEQFVAARRPVVLVGHEVDPALQAHKWTDEYLSQVGGSSVVTVEPRNDGKDTFGQGRERRMEFGKFLKMVADGDELHYMTTQTLPVAADGKPALYAAPVSDLQADFPLRPALMGNLIPFNLNLWMGNSKSGSMSGLHHDYHDNLYVLLRGRKQFRLYSPDMAGDLYTRGALSKIHPNGRINYEEFPTVEDGHDKAAELAVSVFTKQQAAEQLVRRTLPHTTIYQVWYGHTYRVHLF